MDVRGWCALFLIAERPPAFTTFLDRTLSALPALERVHPNPVLANSWRGRSV